jgi:hypothetical protein
MSKPVSEEITAAKVRPGDHLVVLGEGTVEVKRVVHDGGRIKIETVSARFPVTPETKFGRRKIDRRINMRPDLGNRE